jgi:hypothetical protein
MATEARYQATKTHRALAVPTYSGTALTPEEFAEFIDSLREDEIATATAVCNDEAEYND